MTSAEACEKNSFELISGDRKFWPAISCDCDWDSEGDVAAAVAEQRSLATAASMAADEPGDVAMLVGLAICAESCATLKGGASLGRTWLMNF